MNETIIQICSKDRAGEVGMLLTSLMSQTYKNFDVVILDDGSGNLHTNYYFIQGLIIRMKQDGHNVTIIRNNEPSGVSKARQQLVDWSLNNTNSKFMVRIDDDSIVKSDYLEQLIKVINAGYDIACGVVPPLGAIDTIRDIKFVEPIIGECKLNNKGELTMNMDDCGILYSEHKILPTHHFRSCAMFKRELFEGGLNYNSRLSKNGFREEQIISFKALCKGYKIGCNTGAIAWHLLTPSGGERDTMQFAQFNQEIFEDTTKKLFEKYGDFISAYNKIMNIAPKERPTLDYTRANNLVSIKPIVSLING